MDLDQCQIVQYCHKIPGLEVQQQIGSTKRIALVSVLPREVANWSVQDRMCDTVAAGKLLGQTKRDIFRYRNESDMLEHKQQFCHEKK